MQWYVSQNGTTSGPFAEERLAMLLNWGKISGDAYICDEQFCWVSIRRSAFAPLLTGTGVAPAPSRPAAAPPDAVAQAYTTRREILLAYLVVAAFLLLTVAVTALAVWLRPIV